MIMDTRAWGGLWVEYNTTAEAAFGGATPSLVTAWQAPMASFQGIGFGSNTIKIIHPGEYLIGVLGLSFSGSIAKQYHGELFVGEEHSLYGFRAKTTSAGAVDTASCAGLLTLRAGDEVGLYMWSSDGGSVLTINEGQMFALNVGGSR